MIHFNSLISKILLCIVSLLIILNAIFLSKGDTWVLDLFNYLPIFSLVIILDFMIYEINCPDYKGRDHLVFCMFPISRWKVLLIEIKYYFKRWEFIVFLISTLFYITYFYFMNNSKLMTLISLLVTFTVQVIYLITMLFLTKNLFKLKNLNLTIKNFSSILITLIILIYSFANTSSIIEFIFYINPLSSGFLSYLLGRDYCIISYFLILVLTGSFYYFTAKRINEWPLS